MPIIASHHRRGSTLSTKNKYEPSCAWPVDCTVQWGGSGIVISENGVRGTAFFEAFPKDKGFFRGEGKTVTEAEADCFEKWRKFSVCDHQWGRGFIVTKRSVEMKRGLLRPKLRGKTNYTNGGALCKKCNAFATMFKPVHTLGSCKKGPSVHDLTMAAEGRLRPVEERPDSSDMAKYDRASELRLRLAGVDLPPTPDTPSTRGLFEDPNLDPYTVACRKAVVNWYVEHRVTLAKNTGTMLMELFEGFEQRSLDRLVEEERSYRSAQEIGKEADLAQ